MKYLLIALFTSVSFYSQKTSNDVQNKIINDKVAYIHFLELGKCQCMDILIQKSKIYRTESKGKNNNLFDRHYYTLYDLGYTLPVFYKKSEIELIITDFHNNNIGSVVNFYKEKDEHIKDDYSSPFLFCNKLFEEDRMTKELYKKLVYNPNAFISNYQSEEKYLKTK
ncbi:hypothetical protein [Chryseobacterium sp. JK1]|uniref:hypothetical protein n=1 Tax=Chryseobacterium sp. JK1 TaxID=874294 RepID=UPI003D69863A